MKMTQRNHAPKFKIQVALAAIWGDRTLAELAQYNAMRRIRTMFQTGTAIEASAPDVFGGTQRAKGTEPDLQVLYAKMRPLMLEYEC